MMELEALDEKRLQELDHIMIQKKKVARAYNKRVRTKSFEGELLWKVVLPIGAKDRELEKWFPNWERPFKVHQVLPENAYVLSSLKGEPQKVHQWEVPQKIFSHNVGNASPLLRKKKR